MRVFFFFFPFFFSMSVEKTLNFLLGHEFVEEIQNYILILYFHIQDRLKVRRTHYIRQNFFKTPLHLELNAWRRNKRIESMAWGSERSSCSSHLPIWSRISQSMTARKPILLSRNCLWSLKSNFHHLERESMWNIRKLTQTVTSVLNRSPNDTRPRPFDKVT